MYIVSLLKSDQSEEEKNIKLINYVVNDIIKLSQCATIRNYETANYNRWDRFSDEERHAQMIAYLEDTKKKQIINK